MTESQGDPEHAPEILEYPDSGKLDTLSADGERILLTRDAEPAKYWDGES